MNQIEKLVTDLQAAVKIRDEANMNIRDLKEELKLEFIKAGSTHLLDIRLDRFVPPYSVRHSNG